jgi:hypothetical protein
MQGAFIQSLTYAPPSSLGRQLLPFSSWHGLVLEAAGSSYVVGGVPDLDDLLFGVWVCSHSFADGIAVAGDYAAIRRWGRTVKPAQYPAGRAAFSGYIARSLRSPEYWQTDGAAGGGCLAPVWWHMATFAMRDLHMAEAAAWDYPVARIVCHQAVAGELAGNKSLVAGDEIDGLGVLRGAV